MPRRNWTKEETQYLVWAWGTVPFTRICKKLDRGATSVREKSRKLDLGGLSEGKYSMRDVERITGYGYASLMKLFEHFRPVRLRHLGSKKVGHRRFGFNEEELQKIIAALKVHGKAGEVRFNRREVWGICGRPPACKVCGLSDAPHYGRGICEKRRCRRNAPGHCNTCTKPLPPGFPFRGCDRCRERHRGYRAAWGARGRKPKAPGGI